MKRPKYSEDKSFSLSLYDLEGDPADALNTFKDFITSAQAFGLRQAYLSLDHGIHGDDPTRIRIEGWVPMTKKKIEKEETRKIFFLSKKKKEKREEKKLQEKIEENERKHYEKLKLKYEDK